MMQQAAGKRVLALVAALALASAGSALAQDTSDTGAARFDTTQAGGGALDTTGADTSAHMDRDTSAANDTSAVSDTTDTSGVQNPPGYRGMERDTTRFPPEGAQDSASDTTGAEGNGDGYRSERPAAADSADTTAQKPDSTQ
jgi:hypothetical protein